MNENPPVGGLPRRTIPRKILISGALLLLGVVVLVITSIRGNAQYYLTVEELAAGKAGQQTNIRVSGVVLGDTIKYDPQTFHLTFTIAHIPGGNREIEAQGGLADILNTPTFIKPPICQCLFTLSSPPFGAARKGLYCFGAGCFRVLHFWRCFLTENLNAIFCHG